MKLHIQVSSAALALFEFGQKIAESRGLLLVDTKYEFGITEDGEILLIDEIHTPDSSRSTLLFLRQVQEIHFLDQLIILLALQPVAMCCSLGFVDGQPTCLHFRLDFRRYWIAETYQERHAAGQEPQNIDKEFLRLWFRSNCDPYKDEVLPPSSSAHATASLIPVRCLEGKLKLQWNARLPAKSTQNCVCSLLGTLQICLLIGEKF